MRMLQKSAIFNSRIRTIDPINHIFLVCSQSFARGKYYSNSKKENMNSASFKRKGSQSLNLHYRSERSFTFLSTHMSWNYDVSPKLVLRFGRNR